MRINHPESKIIGDPTGMEPKHIDDAMQDDN